MSESYYCPWDKSWHADLDTLITYCKSNGWIAEEATVEEFEARMTAVVGGHIIADNTIPVQTPWPDNTPRPRIFGKDL